MKSDLLARSARTRRLGRRAFLGAGLTTILAAPFARLRRLEAQGRRPVRLILCTAANGVHRPRSPETWNCSGGERGFELSSILRRFEPDRRKMVFFSGIDNKGPEPLQNTGHEPMVHTYLRGENTPGYAGAPESPSIDQLIAARLDGHALPNLAVSIRGESKSVFRDMSGRRVQVDPSPTSVFETALGDTMAPAMSAADLRFERSRGRSVLDFLDQQLAGLQTELCGAEREMLDAHLDSVRRAEQALGSIEAPPAGACAAPMLPGDLRTAAEDPMRTPAIADAQIENVVAAVACGVTPVVSFAMHGDDQPGNSDVYPFLEGIDGSRPHHSYAHSNDDEDYHRVAGYWLDTYQRLVQRLDEIPEGDGTLLDHCIVLYMNDMHDGGAHSPDNLPIVLAGSGAGQIETNRYLSYGGAPANDFFVSLARLMGVPLEGFGRSNISNGPLSGFVDV